MKIAKIKFKIETINNLCNVQDTDIGHAENKLISIESNSEFVHINFSTYKTA